MTVTTEAATQLGEALTVLEREGICGFMDAMNALLSSTPAGGTPERDAALTAFNPSDVDAPQRE